MLRSPRDSSGFLEDVLRISSGVPEDLQKISKDCLKDSFRFPQDFLKVSAPCEGLAFDRGINPTGPLDQSRGLCASWSRGLCGVYTLATCWPSRARVPRAAARPGSSGGGGGPRAAVACSIYQSSGRPRCRGRNVFHFLCGGCFDAAPPAVGGPGPVPIRWGPRGEAARAAFAARVRGGVSSIGVSTPLYPPGRPCGR